MQSYSKFNQIGPFLIDWNRILKSNFYSLFLTAVLLFFFLRYAWSPGECGSCHNHLGWYITSGPTHQMKPKSFWVLCSESLKMAVSCNPVVGEASNY